MKGAAGTDLETALSHLDDYVRGRENGASVAEYETELFERALAGSAPEVAFHAGLASTLRLMNARGSLDLWICERDIERVRASGLKAMVWEWTLEHPLPPEIPPGTDLVITRIPLPLAGVRTIDAEIYSADGRLLKRMPDVLFEPADGAIFACCEAELARAAASAPRTLTKVWAVSDGERRLVAELTT
jgi:hypothetical protein